MASKRRHCLKQKTINPEKRQREKTIKFFKKKTDFFGQKPLQVEFFCIPLHRNFAKIFKQSHNVLRSREEKRDLWHLRQKQY